MEALNRIRVECPVAGSGKYIVFPVSEQELVLPQEGSYVPTIEIKPKVQCSSFLLSAKLMKICVDCAYPTGERGLS